MTNSTFITPLKSLGQNFLRDKNLSKKIVSLLGDIEGKTLVEIGPGMGALTSLLLDSGANVIAFEKDIRAKEYLLMHHNSKRLMVHLGDIREVMLAEYVDTPISVIGNIPYNITNDIVFWLFDNVSLIRTAVLTIQKEVAQRYTAQPKTKDYGITTLAMQLYGTAKIAFHISPSAFYPPPKVTSSVLTIDFTTPSVGYTDFVASDKEALLSLIKAGFSQRRKKLRSALKSYIAKHNLGVKEGQSVMYLDNRAEELSLNDFIELYQALHR